MCVCPITPSFPAAAVVMELIIKIEVSGVSAVPLSTRVIYWVHCTK